MASVKGNTLLTLEIKNGSSESIEGIVSKIADIKIKDITESEENHIINIEYSSELDPRENIFNYAKKSKWIVLEMSPYKTNLEDVFRSLTEEEVINA